MSPLRAFHGNHMKKGGVVAVTLSGGKRSRGQQVPATLAEAHDVLWRQRPARGADLREWVAFHRRSAAVYAETAKVDLRHQHEATQCAGVEIRKARTIEEHLGLAGDGA